MGMLEWKEAGVASESSREAASQVAPPAASAFRSPPSLASIPPAFFQFIFRAFPSQFAAILSIPKSF